MLDTFQILTTSGVVLWSRSYAQINPAVVNSFIADVFIEEKLGLKDSHSAATNPPFKSDHHTLKWTLAKDLGVIFVVNLASLSLALLLSVSFANSSRPHPGSLSLSPSPLMGR